MNKKKKIIVFLILIIAIIIIICLRIFIPKIIRKMNNDFVENLNYDIYIQYNEKPDKGGYANSYTYRVIDLQKKKLYIIHNYYVWGITDDPDENGNHYTIKEKDLNEDQIKNLQKLYSENLDFDNNDYFNYTIKVNGKEMKLKSLPFKDDLW